MKVAHVILWLSLLILGGGALAGDESETSSSPDREKANPVSATVPDSVSATDSHSKETGISKGLFPTSSVKPSHLSSTESPSVSPRISSTTGSFSASATLSPIPESSEEAVPAGGEEILRFRYWMVPFDKITEWPWGDAKYYPVAAKLFEKWIGDFKRKEQTRHDRLHKAGLAELHLSARLEGDSFVEGKGTARFIGEDFFDRPFLWDPWSLSFSSFLWENGESASIGVYPDGLIYLAYPKREKLLFDWTMRGKSNEMGNLIFDFALISSPVTELVLKIPEGWTPLLSDGMAEQIAEAKDGTVSWMIRPGGKQNFRLTLVEHQADSKGRDLIGISEHLSYRLSTKGVDVQYRSTFDDGQIKENSLAVVLDSPLLPTSFRWKGESSEATVFSRKDDSQQTTFLIRVPANQINEEAELTVTAFTPADDKKRLQLPRIRMESSGIFWKETDVQLVVEPPLTAVDFELDDAAQVFRPFFSNPSEEKTAAFRLFDAKGRITVLLSKIKPDLLFSSGSEIFYDSGEVGFKTDLVVTGDSGITKFELDIADHWKIETVDSPGGVSFWRMIKKGDGGSKLIISLKTPLSPTIPVKVQLVGRCLKEWTDDTEIENLSPLDLRRVLRGDHLLAFRSEFPYKVVLLDSRQRPIVPETPEESVRRQIFSQLPLGTTISLGSTSSGMKVRIDKTTPAYVGNVVGNVSVTEGGIQEDWTIHCIPPSGVRVDRVLVAFSCGEMSSDSPKESSWEWDLVSESENGMTVTEFSGAERRQMEIPPEMDVREIRLITSRSIPFDIHARRHRKIEDRLDIPLFLLPETAKQSAEIRVASPDMIPIEPNTRRLSPVSSELPPADEFETTVGKFRYSPEELLSTSVTARPALTLRTRGDTRPRELGWCRYFRLESQYVPDGMIRNHLTCFIENAGMKSLHVTLPVPLNVASVFAVWIDGRRAIWYPESDAGNSFHVILPEKRRYVTVSMEYRDKRGPLHLKPHLKPRFPTLTIPILSGDWIARTPPEYASYDSQKRLFRPFPVIQTLLETTLQTARTGDLTLWQDVGAELFGMDKTIAAARKEAETFLNRLGDPDVRRLLIQIKKETTNPTSGGMEIKGDTTADTQEPAETGRQDVLTWGDVFTRPEILAQLWKSPTGSIQVRVNQFMMGKWRVSPMDEVVTSDAPTPMVRAADALEASGLVVFLIRPNTLYVTTVEERETFRSGLVPLGSDSIWLISDSSVGTKIAERTDSDVISAEEWGAGGVMTPWRQSFDSAGIASVIPGWNSSAIPIETSSAGILVVNRYRLAVWKWFLFLLTVVATWRGPLAKSVVLITLIAVIPVFCGMIPPAIAVCLSGALWGSVCSLAFGILRRVTAVDQTKSPCPEQRAKRPEDRVSPTLSATDASEPGFVAPDQIPGTQENDLGIILNGSSIGGMMDKHGESPFSIVGEPVDDSELNHIEQDITAPDTAAPIKTSAVTEVSTGEETSSKDRSVLNFDRASKQENVFKEETKSKISFGISADSQQEEDLNSKKESGRVSFLLTAVLAALTVFIGEGFRIGLDQTSLLRRCEGAAEETAEDGTVKENFGQPKREKIVVSSSEESSTEVPSSLSSRSAEERKPASTKESGPSDSYRVFFPYDHNHHKLEDGYVWIPEELHQKLAILIRSQENLENPWRITRALYEGTVNYNNFTRTLSLFHLKATYTVETESSRSLIRLPMMPLLPDGGVFFDRMPIDPVFLQESGEILFDIDHSFPGQHTLELILMPPPFGTQKTDGVEWRIPRVPDSRLNLTVPLDAPPIQISETFGRIHRSGDQITADLGPTPHILLRPQNQPGKIGDANVDVDQLFLLEAAPNQTILKGEFRVHVYGGKIDSLDFQKDPRYVLTQCSCDETGLEPILSRNERDSERIRIAFKKPVSGDVTLKAEFRIRDFAGIGKIKAPRIRVCDAKITRNRLALFDSPSVEFVSLDGGETVSDHFEFSAEKDGVKMMTTAPTAVYDLSRLGDTWSTSIRLKKGTVNIDQRTMFLFQAAETVIDYQATIKTSDDLFRLEFLTPELFFPDSVTVIDTRTDAAEPVETHTEPGGCRLLFKRPLRGEYRIHMTGVSKSQLDRKGPFPRFYLISPEERTTEIGVCHDRSLCLDWTPPPEWTIAKSDGTDSPFHGENVVFVGNWLLSNSDSLSDASIFLDYNHPKVSGEIQSIFFERLGDDIDPTGEKNWELLTDFSLNVREGELDHLDIEMDETFSDSVIVEPEIPHQVEKRDNKNRVLRILPEKPIRGGFSFRFRCQTMQFPDTLRLPRLKLVSDGVVFSEMVQTVSLPIGNKSRGTTYSWETENLKRLENGEPAPDETLRQEGENGAIEEDVVKEDEGTNSEEDSPGADSSTVKDTDSLIHRETEEEIGEEAQEEKGGINGELDGSDASLLAREPSFPVSAFSPTPIVYPNGTRPSELYFQFGKRRIFPALVSHLSGLTKDDFYQYKATDENFRATFSPGENSMRVLGTETNFFIRRDGTFYGQTIMDVQLDKGLSCILILPKDYEILQAEVDGIPVTPRPLDEERRMVTFFHEYPLCRIAVSFFSPIPYRQRDIRISGIRYSRQILAPVLLEGASPVRSCWSAIFESDTDFSFPYHIDQNKTGFFTGQSRPFDRNQSIPAADEVLLGKGEWKRPIPFDLAAPILVRLNLAKMDYLLNVLDLTVGSSTTPNVDNEREKWFARWLLRWRPCQSDALAYFTASSPIPFTDRQREAIFQKISAPIVTEPNRKKDEENRKQNDDLLREASRRNYQEMMARYEELIEETGLKGMEYSPLSKGFRPLSDMTLWLLNNRSSRGTILIGLTDSEMGEIEILKPDFIQYYDQHLVMTGVFRIVLIIILIAFIWSRRVRRFIIRHLPGIAFIGGCVWLTIHPGMMGGIFTVLTGLAQILLVLRRNFFLWAKSSPVPDDQHPDGQTSDETSRLPGVPSLSETLPKESESVLSKGDSDLSPSPVSTETLQHDDPSSVNQ